MIVWLQNALFMVIDQPDDAGLFDGLHDPWHRLQQGHPLPLCRFRGQPGVLRVCLLRHWYACFSGTDQPERFILLQLRASVSR
jgi:hypothetical protein